MGYFKGTNKMVFIDNKMETGNFFDLLEAGISFCFRNLRLSGEVKGLLREEKLEIPDEALREALTNALCHRQYERTNGSVSLAIYDDRVEIATPEPSLHNSLRNLSGQTMSLILITRELRRFSI